MAQISNITSSQNPLLTNVAAPTAPTEATPGTGSGQSAPAFQETLTTQGRIFALGLGAPRNHGDIEALFAEIATKFGVETAKAKDFAEAAEDAKRSTSLRAAAGNLGLVAALGGLIKTEQDNIAKQTRAINLLKTEIAVLKDEKATLEAQYAVYREEWNDNAETQLSNAGKIVDLGFELIGALGDEAETDRINAEIDALEAENSALFDRNLVLDGLMFELSGQIIEVSFQILGKEIELGWAELSKSASESAVGFLQGILDALAVIFIPFSVDLALRTIGEVGRASFEVTPDQVGLDKSVDDATNNISDQAQRMGEIEAARKALEQLPKNDPETLAAIEAFLAGKGLPEGAEGGAVDTRAITDLLAALRQMISTGQTQETDGKPLASDPARGALDDNLPPGSGDPKRVASEAAGLAGGLALLRGILGQVAEGEASQGTQVPGPSGRLTLAI